MKILLIYPWEGKRDRILPPLGLLCIASVLEKAGHTVRLFNTNTEHATYTNLNKENIGFSPDVVGLSATSLTINEALSEARQMKEIYPDIPVVIGGPHSTACPQQVLENPNVDFVVRGEGELTCLDLIKEIEGVENFEKILGLSYRINGKVIHNSSRPLIPDLDILPFPSYHLLNNINSYTFPQQTRKKSWLTCITSRGCEKACVFCSVFLATGQAACWRGHSSYYVVNLFEYLIDKFKIKELSVQDDNFAADPKRAESICDEIIARGLNEKVCWRAANGVRADCVSKTLLQKMRSAGCYHVGFGIESGNQQILNQNGKGETLEEIRMAVHWANEAGLRTNGSFIFGMLGDNESTMIDTINFSKSLPLDQASFNMMIPIVGSTFFKIVKKRGKFIVNPDDPIYWSGEEALFELDECTKQLMERMHSQAYKDFYSRPLYLIHQLTKIRSLDDFNFLFNGFNTVLNMVSSKK